jgi:hypothetical protein
VAGAGDEVDAAVGETVAQVLGIDRWHDLIFATLDYADRSLDAGQQISQERELFAVGLGVGNRIGEPVSLVARHVVLADLVSWCVSVDRAERDLDYRSATELAIRFQVGGLDPVLQHPGHRNRHRCAAAANDETTEAARIRSCRKQCRRRPDIRRHDMWVVQIESVRNTHDKLAHRAGIHQFLAALRSAEPWWVNRDQVRILGQSRPHLLERKHAFRPWTQQDRFLSRAAAVGESDRQAVDGREFRTDELAHEALNITPDSSIPWP